ncbi:MAG: protein phosphatase [Burkholderiales bacterium RIFCSPLOWO2_02_FULL_57_36]|nr:MAG: protein phosphatase [Burkholderiales bacterium RIFCSPLOWO2_02_FULL_57_36]
MPYQVELKFAARTDTGLVRSHNEDSLAISADYGFAILADGMGGYNAGEVASGIATSVLKESLEQRLHTQQWDIRLNRGKRIQQMLVESIIHANESIFEAARINPENTGMGTTLVVALFHHDRVTVAHVGDSRAYRLRKGEIVQITHDHSMLQEQIDAGLVSEEGAQFARNRNLITRAMGVDYDIDVEIHEHQTEPGDIYILCSDGLSDMLSKQEILDTIITADASSEAACDELIKKANDNGGRDNISVILIRVQSEETEYRGPIARILNWLRQAKAG